MKLKMWNRAGRALLHSRQTCFIPLFLEAEHNKKSGKSRPLESNQTKIKKSNC